MPVRDSLLTEREMEEETDPELDDCVTGEPSVLLELVDPPCEDEESEADELVWIETVSVVERVRVDVEAVPAGTVELEDGVGKLEEAPVLRETPVLIETPVLSEGVG